jgi:flagellin FlaB
MTSKLKQLLRDERGITALETAIILIAFVVVASVFAFTILSAGTFSTERGREAIYAGLEQVSSSMEVYGSVYAESNVAKTQVVTMTFTLASVSGGSGTVITDSTASNANVVISYQDNDTYVKQLDYDVNWIVGGTDDDLLEEGELAEVEIILTSGQDGTINLSASKSFKLEVKPPQGGVLPILRTTPPSLDTVMSLN